MELNPLASASVAGLGERGILGRELRSDGDAANLGRGPGAVAKRGLEPPEAVRDVAADTLLAWPLGEGS